MITIICVQFVVGWVIDQKEAALSAPLVILLTRFVTTGRVPMRWLVCAAVGMALVFPVMTAKRIIMTEGLGLNRVEALSRTGEILRRAIAERDVAQTGKKYGQKTQTFLQRATDKGAVERFAAHVGVDHPYRMGSTLEPMLYAFIPRLLWSDKPGESSAQLFNREFRLSEDRDTYISPTHIGELYWNFGMVGVITGMTMIGLLLGAVCGRFDQSRQSSITGVLVLIVTLYELVVRRGGQIEVEYVVWIRTLVLIWLLHWLLAKRSQPTAVTGTGARAWFGIRGRARAAFFQPAAMMNWRVGAAAAVLAAVLLLRFVLGAVFLLPSPVGDSEFFLTSSINLCSAGFFGTTVYPIDPSGQARMIWHGFVSPMLYSTLNVDCSARGYYLVAWGLQLLTCASVLLLARARGHSFVPAVGMAFLALAAQIAIGFRPEALAVLLIVLAELAIQFRQYAVLGALAGTLACTQPTVAALYAVSMALLRPELLRQWLPAAGGAIAAVLLLFWIYPFPATDLLTGILLQAKKLAGRADGSLISYYLLLPSLPAWGLLLLGTAALAARQRPMLLLIAPLAWYFGPRVPPVFYNLIPLCILLVGVLPGSVLGADCRLCRNGLPAGRRRRTGVREPARRAHGAAIRRYVSANPLAGCCAGGRRSASGACQLDRGTDKPRTRRSPIRGGRRCQRVPAVTR